MQAVIQSTSNADLITLYLGISGLFFATGFLGYLAVALPDVLRL